MSFRSNPFEMGFYGDLNELSKVFIKKPIICQLYILLGKNENRTLIFLSSESFLPPHSTPPGHSQPFALVIGGRGPFSTFLIYFGSDLLFSMSSSTWRGSMSFDKNSLLGRGSILGRQLCVKGVLAQDLGFVWGRFSGDSGDFGVEGAISTICRGPAGVLEAHRGTPVPSAPYS